MKLFALHHTRALGEKIAASMGTTLSELEEREFEDGEHKARPLENVRRQDVFVIHSLYGEPGQSENDKLCRLLFFIAALKDASAARVTAIVPYLCYARKDRRTKPRDPVTTRYIAQLFEAVGTDHILTIDAHNIQAYQNSFRIPAEHLEAKKLFAEFMLAELRMEDLVVMSPDIGGVKRAEQFQRLMTSVTGRDTGLAFMEKFRSSGEVWGQQVVGDVGGKTVVVIDDLVSTGGTLSRSAQAARNAGATKVYAVATHGLFTGDPEKVLAEESLFRVAVTNTVPPFRLAQTKIQHKVHVIDAAPLFAEAIICMYEGGSISKMMAE